MVSQVLINETLQLAKENDLPFGGLTILFSGDFARKGKLSNLNTSHKKGQLKMVEWLG
jgi:hypothetical protein